MELDEIATNLGFAHLHRIGLTGKKVKVVVADTGIYNNHPLLINRVKGGKSFVRGEDENDYCGHGTSVSSIIAKLAPDVEIYNAKVLDKKGSGNVESVLSAYDYAIGIGADLINFSMGSPVNCCVSSVAFAHYHALLNDVYPVYAVGNFGEGKLACPGMLKDAIAVGSANLDGSPAVFSSCGVGCFGERKPLCMEYGGGDDYCVITAWSPKSILFSGEYACVRGTSQATPIFTALMALVIQWYEEKVGVKPKYTDFIGWTYGSTNTFVKCGGRGVVNAFKYFIASKTMSPKAVDFMSKLFVGLGNLFKNKDVTKSILMFLPIPWYVKMIIYSRVRGG